MRNYIQPTVEIHNGTLARPVLLSLHNEVGEGQLTNYGNFDFDDLSLTTNKSVWGEENETEE